MADSKADNTAELLGHVKDADYFHVPRMFLPEEHHGHLRIPQPFKLEEPIIGVSDDPQALLEPLDFKITKFMLLEVVAAMIVAVLFISLANRISGGRRPRGRLWNLLETFVVFIRDDVARKSIGHHDGDRFVPFLATLFFFVLACNLLGMVPWTGTATGAMGTTLALALITFCVVVGSGMKKLGPVGFWAAQVPPMDLPLPIAVILKPFIFAIEVFGLAVKHFVLSVRLLANMFAGHLVLAVLIGFIAQTSGMAIWYGVVPASVLGSVALSLLELLVAFIQAYIFAFLASLFIGMAVHPH